ncbi:NrsF family protein [Polaromonas sp. CG_9.11]|uniref:NrsF family protein n=1 Tax=Polaromonas sp. CG_9.11 TaxID=2787730 RepID=UPI0018C928B1|nr:DUF1109 domain-containing protein [Polaromonas sp. CG_9.11]MBG6076211.1 hypothetical protein [Polaromonas sp. CG_9.11]
MKTDALIDMLARGAGAAPRAVALRRLAPAAVAGLMASSLLAVGIYGPLPSWMFATSAPWIKLVYSGLLVAAALWLAARAALPVVRMTGPWRAVGIVVLAMLFVGGAVMFFGIVPGQRMESLMGQTWRQCPWNVLVLSLPALALILWAMRGLAPTRPCLAGFASGLLAGALGAFGYSLSCPEASPAFIAAWYSLGVVLTGAVGAAFGPRLLRW